MRWGVQSAAGHADTGLTAKSDRCSSTLVEVLPEPMTVTKTHQLTDLQLAILRLLWTNGEATVADIWEALHEERGLAQSTLATILTRLERRGVVTHRTVSRQFIYRALITEADARHSMVSELTERLFEGDVPALVNHLLAEQDVSPGDLKRIRDMLDSAATKRRKTP